MGIVLLINKGTLVWNNSVFADWVKVDWNKLQKCLLLCLASVLIKSGKIWIYDGKYEDKYFQIIYKFIDPRDTRPDINSEDELAEHAVMALYFKNITDLEKARIKAEEDQPVWGMIQIDNLEELTKGLSDREYTSVWTDIKYHRTDEIDRQEGFIRNSKMICIPLLFLVVHFMRWRKTVLKSLRKSVNYLLRVKCLQRFLSGLART